MFVRRDHCCVIVCTVQYGVHSYSIGVTGSRTFVIAAKQNASFHY